jgi:crooked neck
LELEIKLKEFDRVRKIYNKYIESFPKDPKIWLGYADFENQLNDIDRSRAIYQLALETLENNDEIWQSYIEFEKDHRNYDKIRKLFEDRLSKDSSSTKLWINYAIFELSVPSEKQLAEFDSLEDDSVDFEFDITEDSKSKAREVYNRALKHFKSVKASESRIVIFESLKKFEQVHGTDELITAVEKRFPVVVKKIRELDDGSKQEYFDYIFPDDEKMSKFLSNAKKWAREKK